MPPRFEPPPPPSRPANKHYSSAKLSPGKSIEIQSMPIPFNYTTGINMETGKKTAPCSKPKINQGKCTVLLEFMGGQPILRYCPEKGQRGIVVKVNTAEEAERLSTAACKKFHKTGCYPRQRNCDPRIAVRRKTAHDRKIAANRRAAVKRLKEKARARRQGLGETSATVPWALRGERGAWLTFGLPAAAVVLLLAARK